MQLIKIKRMRAIAGILSFAMMFVSIFQASAIAAEPVKETESVKENTGGWKEEYFIWGTPGMYSFTEDPNGTVIKGFTSEGLKYCREGHTDVVFPDKATEIYKNAFLVDESGKIGITSISGKNIKKIGKNAFKNEGKREGKEVFKGNNIQTISCPALEEIEKEAFANVYGDRSYNYTYKKFIGNEISDLSSLINLKTIGNEAFKNISYTGSNQNIQIDEYRGNKISVINLRRKPTCLCVG